jgi:flagellar hook-associated protein 1 FlgK
MALSSALSVSLAGLRTTQAQIEVVSQNVANADSIGYTRRRISIVQELTGDRTGGVRVAAVDRAIDTVVQRQLRTETSGAAYTDVRAEFLSRLDQVFGGPGVAGSLDSTFNAFVNAAQALANDPGNFAARNGALSATVDLANRINGASADVQALRDGTEARLAASVDRMNTLLRGIDQLNRQITATNFSARGEGNAPLQDERDRLIDELSTLVDISVVEQQNGGIAILTRSGLSLVGNGVAQFAFDRRYNLSANNLYDPDPTRRGVGAITLIGQGGIGSDMVGSRAFRSGEIAALLELRDVALVEAQSQLDDLAAGLADTTSNRQVDGVAVPGGFDVDLAGIQPGNGMTLDYTELPGGQQRRVVVTRVDNPAAAALAEATSNAAQRVIAIDFSGGPAAAAAALNTRLNALAGPGFTVTNPAGSTIRVVGGGARQMDRAFAAIANTGLSGQGPAFPLFSDSATLGNYTGSFENGFPQLQGFAQRITVNPAVLADASTLVRYDATTLAGDATRPNFLVDRLTRATRLFSPTTGIGTAGNPFTGTVAEFARRVVEDQGGNAASAKSLDEGQKIAMTAIQQKFASASGVNIDEELAELIQVQNAYAANTRIISTVRDLFDQLLRI